jgi:hypothetical protein
MEEIKYCYIYKIESPSGRIYIGKTSNIKDRINCYKYLKCKKQRLIYNSLKKHGFSSHKFEIVYEGDNTLLELNKLEIYYIGLYNSFIKNSDRGLNLTLGGDGGFGRKITEEHRSAIINFNKNRVYKPHTDETKKMISISRKKVGKTEKILEYIERIKGRKITKNEDWIKNNSESIKKPILQFSLDGEFIKEWKSAKDVEVETGMCRKNIGSNLRCKSKSAYGYVWKFKNCNEDNEVLENI